MGVASIGEVGGGGRDVGHGYEGYTEVGVRGHGETEAKGLAGFCEALYLPHTAPVVVGAEYDLYRVEAGGFVGREQAFEQAVAALFDLAAGVVDCHRGG